jgi:hypothetical protein
VILVDSSVWIDYFTGHATSESEFLDEILSTDTICIGDVILAEVLQGFRKDADYRTAKEILIELPIFQIMSPEIAIKSAENYRLLRKQGITIRKSVDVWIATFCIENKIALLSSDKNFYPFYDNLKLRKP